MPITRKKVIVPPPQITIDGDGYITVVGSGSLPFKDIVEDLGGGQKRIHHMVKDPTSGEVSVINKDF